MLQINQTIPDFDRPIDLLLACHENIRRFTHILAWSDNPFMLEKALGYFNTTFNYHHDDEDRDIFPIITEVYPHLSGVVDELNSQHTRLAALVSEYNSSRGRETAKELYVLAEKHLQIEEKEIFPVARLLDEQVLLSLGYKMKTRRGLGLIQIGLGV